MYDKHSRDIIIIWLKANTYFTRAFSYTNILKHTLSPKSEATTRNHLIPAQILSSSHFLNWKMMKRGKFNSISSHVQKNPQKTIAQTKSALKHFWRSHNSLIAEAKAKWVQAQELVNRLDWAVVGNPKSKDFIARFQEIDDLIRWLEPVAGLTPLGSQRRVFSLNA